MADHNCSALIIGAGPAGSAAASVIASNGFDVVVVDQYEFPRDKICGDALIPDALSALEQLHVSDPVLQHATVAHAVRVVAPNGTHLELAGRTACLPRRVLDSVLIDHAQKLGAKLLAPYRLESLVENGGTTKGADVVHRTTGQRRRVLAPITLLATGAASLPLQLAGVCNRKEASGIAARLYVRNPRFAHRFDGPCLSFARNLSPGYGWIFPGPDGTFNVGAGVFLNGRSNENALNLRDLFSRFVESFEPASELLATGERTSALRGAPLRTALRGASFARSGLLVIGEAAGTTYSFSGEGIGKALESGMLAAQLASTFLRGQATLAATCARYSAELLSRYQSRFAAYAAAERWLAHPAFCDFLAARARTNLYVRSRLEGMLTESIDPREIFSVKGFLRSLLPA